MATDWGPVVQFIAGAGAAVGGGAAAAWLQAKSQERIEQRRLRHEEDLDRQQRRERAAETLAEVYSLLQHVQLEQYVTQKPREASGRDLPDALEALQTQEASAQLLLMAIREPSTQVRRLARELAEEMTNSVAMASFVQVGRAVGSDSEVFTRLARNSKESLALATRLLNELVEAL